MGWLATEQWTAFGTTSRLGIAPFWRRRGIGGFEDRTSEFYCTSQNWRRGGSKSPEHTTMGDHLDLSPHWQ
jgi:hypothetical protein